MEQTHTDFPQTETRRTGGDGRETTRAGLYEGLQHFVTAVRESFTARLVYGDPIEAHGVTVIPVAQTAFGVGGGGGGGSGMQKPDEQAVGEGMGGGGGGGGFVRPIGFIEITSSGARWVPIVRPWQRIAMRVLPPLVALMAGRALRRRRLLKRD